MLPRHSHLLYFSNFTNSANVTQKQIKTVTPLDRLLPLSHVMVKGAVTTAVWQPNDCTDTHVKVKEHLSGPKMSLSVEQSLYTAVKA